MDIAQILRSQGFKVTPQRIAIYDALRGHLIIQQQKCCIIRCALNIQA